MHTTSLTDDILRRIENVEAAALSPMVARIVLPCSEMRELLNAHANMLAALQAVDRWAEESMVLLGGLDDHLGIIIRKAIKRASNG